MASQNSKKEMYGTWLIDNGCSNHMSGDRELFETLKNTSQQTVRLEDG